MSDTVPPSAIFAADHMLIKSPASGVSLALSRPATPLSSRDQLKANHAACNSVIASNTSLNVRAIACLRGPANPKLAFSEPAYIGESRQVSARQVHSPLLPSSAPRRLARIGSNIVLFHFLQFGQACCNSRS